MLENPSNPKRKDAICCPPKAGLGPATTDGVAKDNTTTPIGCQIRICLNLGAFSTLSKWLVDKPKHKMYTDE
jgi:hypothetical protein